MEHVFDNIEGFVEYLEVCKTKQGANDESVRLYTDLINVVKRSNLCVQLLPWWIAFVEDEFGIVGCNGRSPVYCFERLKEMGVSWARMQNVIFTLVLSDGSVSGTQNFEWARKVYDFKPY